MYKGPEYNKCSRKQYGTITSLSWCRQSFLLLDTKGINHKEIDNGTTLIVGNCAHKKIITEKE